MLSSHYGGPLDPKQLETLFRKEFEWMRTYLIRSDGKVMLELQQNALELDACFRTAAAIIVIQFHDSTTLEKKGFLYPKERTTPWVQRTAFSVWGSKSLASATWLTSSLSHACTCGTFWHKMLSRWKSIEPHSALLGGNQIRPCLYQTAAQQNGGTKRRSKPTRGEPTGRKKQQVQSKGLWLRMMRQCIESRKARPWMFKK